MTTKSVVLRHSRDASGSRFLEASLAADGTLTINGQDLGSGVEEFFGQGSFEYEWTWTIASKDVTCLMSALESGDDVLAALAKRFSGDAAAGLQPFLKDNEIPYAAWTRTGD